MSSMNLVFVGPLGGRRLVNGQPRTLYARLVGDGNGTMVKHPLELVVEPSVVRMFPRSLQRQIHFDRSNVALPADHFDVPRRFMPVMPSVAGEIFDSGNEHRQKHQ